MSLLKTKIVPASHPVVVDFGDAADLEWLVLVYQLQDILDVKHFALNGRDTATQTTQECRKSTEAIGHQVRKRVNMAERGLASAISVDDK